MWKGETFLQRGGGSEVKCQEKGFDQRNCQSYGEKSTQTNEVGKEFTTVSPPSCTMALNLYQPMIESTGGKMGNR